MLCFAVFNEPKKTSPFKGASPSSPEEEDRSAWEDNLDDNNNDNNSSSSKSNSKFVARPWGWEADAALLEQLYDMDDLSQGQSQEPGFSLRDMYMYEEVGMDTERGGLYEEGGDGGRVSGPGSSSSSSSSISGNGTSIAGSSSR